jgi:pimeloyl-ACP methyl ester carboxylesterase
MNHPTRPVTLTGVLSGLIGVLGALYLLAALYLYTTQEQQVYRPSTQMEETPQAWGIPFESVILTSDGIPIHGWWLPHPAVNGDTAATPAQRPVVLLCHGNAGNISTASVRERARWLHRLGFSLFVFDYRGYGASKGSPDESGSYRDAEAALAFLTGAKEVPLDRVLFYGHSLGGGVASWLALQHPAAYGLVLEGTFRSIGALAKERYPVFPVQWLLRIHYDNEDRMPRLLLPTLILHSADDSVVPFHHGQALFDRLHTPYRRLVRMHGNHDTGLFDSLSDVQPALEEFLNVPRGSRGRTAPPPT